MDAREVIAEELTGPHPLCEDEFGRADAVLAALAAAGFAVVPLAPGERIAITTPSGRHREPR